MLRTPQDSGTTSNVACAQHTHTLTQTHTDKRAGYQKDIIEYQHLGLEMCLRIYLCEIWVERQTER